MIIHKTGNLLDMADQGEFDYIVHGCNCFNNMGAGIAWQIAQRYPSACEIDKKTEKGSYDKLGTYTSATILTKTNPVKMFTIINAYTQFVPSVDKDVFDYAAFDLILRKLAHKSPGANYGFPYIGMGLAGGDPETIIDLLEDFSERVSGKTTLVKFV